MENPLGLLNELKAKTKDILSMGGVLEGSVKIAITIASSEYNLLEGRFGPGMLAPKSDEERLIHDGFTRKGFDVVDIRRLISGLSGCGYDVNVKDVMKREFEKDINNYGLFENIDRAMEFSKIRGMQIRVHAPFSVVSLLVGCQQRGPDAGVL